MKDWIVFADPLVLAPGSVIGIAFLVLWQHDRSRRHLLWWGLATLLLMAGSMLLDSQFRLTPVPGWNIRFSTLCVLLGSVAYWVGACDYAGRALSAAATRRLLAVLGATLLLVNFAPGSIGALVFDLGSSTALLATAALLWPMGRAERLVALLMLARAANPSLLTQLIDGYAMIERVRINQTLAFVIGLLLIVSGFLRSVAELRALRAGLLGRVEESTKELRQAEHELAAANTELEAFTYGVSHDLRAPLRSLDGYSRMLEEDCADSLDAARRDALEELRLIARGVGTLVDDLLHFSRVLRAVPKPEALDVSALFGAAIEDFRRHRAMDSGDARIAPGLGLRADRDLVATLLGLVIEHLVPRPVRDVRIALDFAPGSAPCSFEVRVRGVPAASLRGVAGTSREVTRALLARLIAHCGGTLGIEREDAQGEVLRFSLPEPT